MNYFAPGAIETCTIPRPSAAEHQQAPSISVLATVIVPPHLAVSGGARAAEQLSAALAPYCDITIASMMNGGTHDADTDATWPAGRQATRLAVHSWLPPLLPWSYLPNRQRTLFYRSDIPRMVARTTCDLVHIHNPMPALEMERVARACVARSLPYVISTHGFNEVANGAEIYGFDAVRRQIWRRLVVAPVSRAVRRAASIFVLSPADVPLVRGMGFDGPTFTVANGVPSPGAGDPVADRTALDRLDIPPQRLPGQITCVFLANHTPNKGLPVLLEAFRQLEIPFLLIIGGERRGNVDYDSAIAACRPGQRIVVTGRVTDTEIGAMFRRSDLFVFPTLADTFPLVVLEAMSHGLPVLASAVGGIPYQVHDGCGVLIEPGQPSALAAEVKRLASAPETLAVMGRTAKARAAAEFTWVRAAAQAMAGYRYVLGEGGTS